MTSEGKLDYVRADELIVGNVMVSEHNTLNTISEIWQPKNIDIEYADLTVDEHHNYFTSSNGKIKYVIHNTLGYHTYLQQRGIPFEGLQAQFHTRKIFSQLKLETEKASMDMAKEYGEPLWCKDFGYRNTHLRAIAPTVSNSKLSGNVSAGIEPWAANVYTEQSAKGTFIRKNPELEKVLRLIGKDTKEVWDQILEDLGSVQNLSFLDDWCYYNGVITKRSEITEEEYTQNGVSIKDVFKTFKEINQLDLVRQAGIRQQYIDQAVSLNLAFPSTADPKWINQVHLEAWKKGVKTLYYMRTESVLRGDIASSAMDPNCLSCDG
jgi:ribonucleoside-diphosphate reductase alpha chain